MLLLPANVTAAEANDTRRLLLQAMRGETAEVVTVDASHLQRFDSSALAVLIDCHRAAGGMGKRFAVRQPPPKLAALAKLYGVDTLLTSAVAEAAATLGEAAPSLP
jgi:phospholipid transport system transporter-binding protein